MVLHSTGRGGAEEYALTIARAATANWDVAAAIRQSQATATLVGDLIAAGVRCHRLVHGRSVDALFGKCRGFFNELIGMWRLLQRERPDAVMLVLPTPFVAVTLQVACRLCGCPLAVVFQLVPPSVAASYKRSLLSAWLQRRQCWVAVSAHNRRELSRIFRVNEATIEVIANGASLPYEQPREVEGEIPRFRSELCDSLKIPSDRRLLLTVSRLTPQKGHAVLIAAIPEVLARHPDVEFLWAGDGPIETKLRAAVQQAGLEDRVHFLGRRGDINRLLQVSDLFVFPTCYEGQPFALLEAMARRLPIVSTSASGIAEIITDGVHGLLTPPGDPRLLACRINDALAALGLCKELAAAAKKRVAEFSQKAMVNRTIALLHTLIGQ